jgi:hypothetical protein
MYAHTETGDVNSFVHIWSYREARSWLRTRIGKPT